MTYTDGDRQVSAGVPGVRKAPKETTRRSWRGWPRGKPLPSVLAASAHKEAVQDGVGFLQSVLGFAVIGLPLLTIGCKFTESGSESLALTPGRPVPSALQNSAWKVQINNCSYYHAFNSTERTDLVVCTNPEGAGASYATYAIDTETMTNGEVSVHAQRLLRSSCPSGSSAGTGFRIYATLPSGSASGGSAATEALLVRTRVDPENGQPNSLQFTRIDPAEVTQQLQQTGCFVSGKFIPAG